MLLFIDYITLSCGYREREILSVGLSVVNSVRRGYPPEEGAHIAIRKLHRIRQNVRGERLSWFYIQSRVFSRFLLRSLLPFQIQNFCLCVV